jgi:hypothetical protein
MSSHPRPWHRQSIYGPGPRIPRDREQRARFRYLVRAHLQARRLTHAAAAVAEALLRRLGTDGQCDPVHDTLAADAACSARTVRRACASMLALGLLSWQRRLARNGWRAEQTSNAYCLLIGSSQLFQPGVSTNACGGQSGLQIRRKMNLPSVTPDLHAVAAAQAALARRRAAIEGRLLANGSGGQGGAL